jgi:aminoglycoside 6'-N-acetyltransferase I
MTEVRVLAADDPEVEKVADLLARFFAEEGFVAPAGGMLARLRTYLARPSNAVLVALEAGQPVGVATVATGYSLEYGGIAELEDLYVLPEHRGAGLGHALIGAACAAAAERGCSAILVTITPEGQSAHDLLGYYTRRGFEDDGRRILERRLP